MNISDVVAEALLAGRADAIIAADRDGIIRFWNPGAERLWKAATARSISAELPRLTGVTSTPTEGATDWMTANWPMSATMAGARRTGLASRRACHPDQSRHSVLRIVAAQNDGRPFRGAQIPAVITSFQSIVRTGFEPWGAAMRRPAFIEGIASSAAAWPLVARAHRRKWTFL